MDTLKCGHEPLDLVETITRHRRYGNTLIRTDSVLCSCGVESVISENDVPPGSIPIKWMSVADLEKLYPRPA